MVEKELIFFVDHALRVSMERAKGSSYSRSRCLERWYGRGFEAKLAV